MANPNFLSIDISVSFIRYVFLKKKGHSYAVLKTGALPLSQFAQDESKGVADRVDFFYRVVKAVLGEVSCPSPRLFLTLSQQKHIVIHHLLTPALSGAELKQAVSAEIERLPKFKDRDYDFFFSSQDYKDNQELIVFAALDQEFQDDVEAGAKKTGLECKDVEISPLNLKQVLDACDRRKEGARAGGSGRVLEAFLLIHDESATLELYYPAETRLLYRSSAGIKNLEGKDSHDRDQIIGHWAAEFSRVIKSYLAQNQTEAIETVWFIWDRDLVPDLLEKMRARMVQANLSAPYFTAEERVSGMKDLNPIYILALTPVIVELYKVPACFDLQHVFRKKLLRKEIVRAACVLGLLSSLVIGILLFFLAAFGIQKRALRDNITYNQSEIDRITRQAADFKKQATEYERLYTRLVNQARHIQEINRVSWAQVFSEFTREMPANMALTTFRFSRNNVANMQGEVLDVAAVAEFMRKIEQSSILRNPLFENLNKTRRVNIETLYTFSVQAQLREPERQVVSEESGPQE